MNSSALDRAGETARRLSFLIQHESPHQAQWLTAFATALTSDPDRACELYRSAALWGGPGSVADLSPSSPAGRRSHCLLLIQLHNQLAGEGWTCPRARQLVDIFRRWLATGIV